MKVKVLFFSVLQDIVGTDSLEIELSELESATMDGLLIHFFTRFPELKAWEGRLLFAVNQEFAQRDTELTEGAEVAVMPPVQGG